MKRVTFSTPERDPRSWIITGSYLVLLDGSKYSVQAGDDTNDVKWFQVSMRMKEGVWQLKLQSEDETVSAFLRDTSSPWDVIPKLEMVGEEGHDPAGVFVEKYEV